MTRRTWFAWIRAGLIRKAPIQRTGGSGRGGRRSYWTRSDLTRARKVRALLDLGETYTDVAKTLGPPEPRRRPPPE